MSKSYQEGFDWDSYNKLKEMEGNRIFDFITCTPAFKAQLKELEDLKERWQITRRLVTETGEVTLDELREVINSVEATTTLLNKRIRPIVKHDGAAQRSLKLSVGGQTVVIIITGSAEVGKI